MSKPKFVLVIEGEVSKALPIRSFNITKDSKGAVRLWVDDEVAATFDTDGEAHIWVSDLKASGFDVIVED